MKVISENDTKEIKANLTMIKHLARKLCPPLWQSGVFE